MNGGSLKKKKLDMGFHFSRQHPFRRQHSRHALPRAGHEFGGELRVRVPRHIIHHPIRRAQIPRGRVAGRAEDGLAGYGVVEHGAAGEKREGEYCDFHCYSFSVRNFAKTADLCFTYAAGKPAALPRVPTRL